MSKFVIIGYYTEGSGYKHEADNLRASAEKLGIENCIGPMPDLGTWQKNVLQKAKLILTMLDATAVSGRPIVYLDADSEIKSYPAVFDQLILEGVDFACGYLDHQKFGHWRRPWFELIGSVLYFANNDKARIILRRWINENENHPHVWDQKNLQQVINNIKEEENGFYKIGTIPESYFTIFDTMARVENPVIMQYQKSRVYKRQIDGARRFANGNAA